MDKDEAGGRTWVDKGWRWRERTADHPSCEWAHFRGHGSHAGGRAGLSMGTADLVARRDRRPGVDLRNAAVRRVRPALPVFARVVVVQLRVDALVLDHVLKREPHLPALAPSALAALRSETVDQLLL